jgi:hypothetical protein
VSSTADTLRNQGIHVEASLIKMKRQLGTPPADAKYDIAESSSEGGQRGQLVVHF